MDERLELQQTTARRAGFKGLAVVPQTAFTAWTALDGEPDPTVRAEMRWSWG